MLDIHAGADGLSVNERFLWEVLNNLSLVAPSDSVFLEWRNELFSRLTVDYTNRAAVEAWHQGLLRLYTSRLVASRPCARLHALYDASQSADHMFIADSIASSDDCCNRWVKGSDTRPCDV